MNEHKPKLKIHVANTMYSPLESEGDSREVAGGRLMAEIIRVIEHIMATRGMTRRELAHRLRRSESTISRQLDGNGNLTVETIAEIFWALEDQPYLSSAGYDCLAHHGHAVDFRPTAESAAASSWLGVLHQECKAKLAASLGGQQIRTSAAAAAVLPVSSPTLAGAAEPKGLKYALG